jgi:hypothetical protein
MMHERNWWLKPRKENMSRPDYTKEFKQEILDGLNLQAKKLNADTYKAVKKYIENGEGLGFTTYTAIEDLIHLMNKTQCRIRVIRNEMKLLDSEINGTIS